MFGVDEDSTTIFFIRSGPNVYKYDYPNIHGQRGCVCPSFLPLLVKLLRDKSNDQI